MLNGFGEPDQIKSLVSQFQVQYTGKCFFNGANLLVKDEIVNLIRDAETKFDGSVDILGYGSIISDLLRTD